MKRELIRKIILVAIEKGIIEKGSIDIIERAEEVTTIISEELFNDMKSGIKTELESYADELERDLEQLGLSKEEVGTVFASFLATFTNVMDFLGE